MKSERISTVEIRAKKAKTPLVCMTAYTAPMAKILDAHADILLVGDSVGMVLYGLESTLSVTLPMMLAHGRAVVHASQKACVIVDMPFATYQESKEQAFRNAAQIMSKTGCAGVKLEGGVEIAETARFLIERGIPVMGHIGLLPQSVHRYGGYRHQGRLEKEQERLSQDAKALEQGGVFALVLESIFEPCARRITAEVSIPTIGIGASPFCDGQVLVTEDMLGLFDAFVPPFVKRYANLAVAAEEAVRAFAGDVRARRFPTAEHCFK